MYCTVLYISNYISCVVGAKTYLFNQETASSPYTNWRLNHSRTPSPPSTARDMADSSTFNELACPPPLPVRNPRRLNTQLEPCKTQSPPSKELLCNGLAARPWKSTWPHTSETTHQDYHIAKESATGKVVEIGGIDYKLVAPQTVNNPTGSGWHRLPSSMIRRQSTPHIGYCLAITGKEKKCTQVHLHVPLCRGPFAHAQ